MGEEAPEQRRGGSYGDFAILKHTVPSLAWRSNGGRQLSIRLSQFRLVLTDGVLNEYPTTRTGIFTSSTQIPNSQVHFRMRNLKRTSQRIRSALYGTIG